MSNYSCIKDGKFAQNVANTPGLVRIEIAPLKNSLTDPTATIRTYYHRGVYIVEIVPRKGEKRSTARRLIPPC